MSFLGTGLYYLLFGLLVAISGVAFRGVQDAVPDPYMDEIFHVPQAKHYCRANFTHWDNKITTLPGLYLLSVGVLKPLAPLFGSEETGSPLTSEKVTPVWCSTLLLRSLNLFLSLASFVLLHRITIQIHGRKHYYCEYKALLSAFNLVLFPLSFFFSGLYYTDMGSTFMVLLMYCMHLDGKDYAAAFLGAVSVIFRQTNIIWVAFVAGQSASEPLVEAVHEKALSEPEHTLPLDTRGQIMELFKGLLALIMDPMRLLRLVFDVVVRAGGYLLVWFAFAAFLSINGGVVVGDKQAHVATFHPTQLLYFAGFCLVFSLPFCVAKIPDFFNFARRRPIFIIASLLSILACIHLCSPAHKYLLADNRHLTFYVWRRILTRTWWTKYAAAPAYLFGGFCILFALRRTNVVFKLTFPLLTLANLSPQLLLEFRYFTVPFLFYRLHLSPQSWLKLVAETALFATVNAAVFYLFLERRFKWEHEPEEWQRIMW